MCHARYYLETTIRRESSDTGAKITSRTRTC